MIRSIRFVLTLWYIGIFAVLFSLFGWALYSKVASNLFREVDAVLASNAGGAADTLFAFWKAEQESAPGPKSKEPLMGLDAVRFPGLLARWSKQTNELLHPLRIITVQGGIALSSPGFEKLSLPLSAEVIQNSRRGLMIYQTFRLPENRVRLVTFPVIEDGRLLYMIQAASSLREADVSLAQLRLWLLILIPCVLVVVSSVGWFLVTAALRPVDQTIQKAKSIGLGDLHERIGVPRTHDELERLARTFNEMLERLDRSVRRLRQFSAAASHELRTPLSILRGELEVSLRKPRDAEEYRRVLRTQLEVVTELENIVSQLLTLAYTEEGEAGVEWKPLELVKLVREACELWQKVADDKKIAIEIAESPALWIRGEKRLLERLVSNLLENAIKHSPVEGRVTLTFGRQGHEAYLAVEDTGPGISPDELPFIFDKFFIDKTRRADASRGIGLGLGLCRWIAEAHQGRIEVGSAPAGGAVFKVRFPVMDAPQANPAG